MLGKIIKGIAGFYYIHVPEKGLYECKAKGIFRNQKIKPLVGDNVEVTVLDEKEKKGNLIKILPRQNELIRPAVSNIDQALIIFAAVSPAPNLNLLDRFLLMMEKQKVETIICFNKSDIADEKDIKFLNDNYKWSGYRVLTTSVCTEEGFDELRGLLRLKTTVLAGPSGVGKSSIINKLQPDANMETGEISQKIKRGKHTTRHSELFPLDDSSYIMDTPGFGSLFIQQFDARELKDYYPEFLRYEAGCKFQGCVHISEPECSVKEALEEGKISRTRYDNYVQLYEELKEQKKY